jgi:hypothetical protein
MWKLLIKLEDTEKWHEVYGMGMAFPGFHVIDQAASFIIKNLDAYVLATFGKVAEVEEVSIVFKDKV